LDAPGHYTIIIENPEAFEQDIEVNMSIKQVTIIREVKYIQDKQLGRRTSLINIKDKNISAKIYLSMLKMR